MKVIFFKFSKSISFRFIHFIIKFKTAKQNILTNRVYLKNNKLTNIPRRAFRHRFYSIDLRYNQLTELDNLTFDGVLSIGILDLSNNKLEKVAPGSFNNFSYTYFVFNKQPFDRAEK